MDEIMSNPHLNRPVPVEEAVPRKYGAEGETLPLLGRQVLVAHPEVG